MRELSNGHLLATEVADLPDFTGCDELYADFETSGLDPYLGDEPVGLAVLRDNEKKAIYVPTGHLHGPNIPRDSFDRWVQDIVVAPRTWINHNIKFDAHFAAESCNATFDCGLEDTLAFARLIDSDRFKGYALKPLCRDWLNMPMDEEAEIKPYLLPKMRYGHAPVPSDIEGKYACMDVIGNRALYKWMLENRAEVTHEVWDTERLLTPVLWDMERRGMRIDVIQTKVAKLKAIRRIVELGDEIAQLIGYEYTDSAKVLRDVLVIQYALPILGWNIKKEQGREVSRTPSFDKEALSLYAIHPLVTSDAELTRLIALITEFREQSQFHNLYLEPYLNLADDNGVLHPSYRQVIRTGRMAGSHPNPQQLNKPAKRLIIPEEGRGFLSGDASQVEFRWIGHYIEDDKIISAFNEDANTDYHSLIAELIHSTRSQGKTMNFALGFGAQEAKVVSMLKKDPDIMAEIAAMTDDPEEFDRLCVARAKEIWHAYHKMLPTLRTESFDARRAAKRNGLVVNAFGRPRHLGAKGAYKAFNAVIQSTAMDYIKTRMVALAPRYNPQIRAWGLDLMMNVHDRLVWEGPIDVVESREVQQYVSDILDICPVECSIPMRWDIGSSRINLAVADDNSETGANDA